MARGNVDLIFSVAELARLFDDSDDLNQFLHNVVMTIAEHLQADVSSVYLFDKEEQELVLTATVGLAPESVGNVRLRLGEGITGTAVQEQQPIRVAHGEDHPAFKYFAGIREEEYTAFIAVPIMRGKKPIGALTVQHHQADHFTEDDTKTVSAIAAQLASTIEHTRLLINVEQKETPSATAAVTEGSCPGFVNGKAGTKGIAHGRATILSSGREDYLHAVLRSAEKNSSTVQDFEKAFRQTQQQIRELERMLEEKLGEESAALIFSGHQLMLADKGFSGYIRSQIEEQTSPAQAIMNAVQRYVDIFSESPSPILCEKTQDIRDLGYRLLQNLAGTDPTTRDYEGRIVIAKELLPSDILKLSAQGVSGVILLSGSLTSHVSVLVQSLDLPLVMAGDERLLNLADGTEVLIDAYQGNVFIAPHEDVLQQYRELMKAKESLAEETADIAAETWTADDERIHLMANINLCSDLSVAKQVKAEGVGLYRSEFPFIIRNDFPSEEEQLAVYQRVLNEMEDEQVIFRTLDIGGDKVASYAPNREENNPFMGLRAIRFSLKNKEIFSDQLRALLRAAAGRPLYVMFPLIGSYDDFSASKQVLFECKKELEEKDIPHAKEIYTGAMIELPSSVCLIDVLAAEADFLSIGSNDLVQYLLAVDRTNKDILHLYKPFHPAVLRTLKQIVDAASAAGTPVSLCGELATDPQMLPFLLGIGLRKLSMDAHRIPAVQRQISTLRISEAQRTAQEMLKRRSTDEIEALLAD